MLRNFVEENASGIGSASVANLNGAPVGRRTWRSGFTNGSVVFYEIADATQFEWGIGLLTYGTPDTLTRTTVLGNSAGTTARLAFAGACRIYNEVVSERAVYIGSNGGLSADLGQIGLPMWAGTPGGTGDAITATVSPAPTALIAGMQVVFVAASANTGAVTINLNGLGAKSLVKSQVSSLGALRAGDLYAGAPVQAVYDGTQFRLLSQPPGELGWRLLSEQFTGSSISSMAIALPTGYLRYRLDVQDMAPSLAASLYLRWSFDGGATYASGASDYGFAGSAVTSAGTQTLYGSAAVTYAPLTPSGGTAAVHGSVDFVNFGAKYVQADFVGFFPGMGRYIGAANCTVAGTATHVLLGFVGANITAGRARLFGTPT